jgi:hypothetical protein
MTDMPLQPGSYVRIYPEALRYDVASVDWRAAILHETEDFVVVAKPAGLPCAPTASNFHDNVMESVRREVQCEKIHNPHRLDVATSGVLVFGKTRRFARDFGLAIRRHEVTKTYKLLVVKSFRRTSPAFPLSLSSSPPFSSGATARDAADADATIQFPAVGTALTHHMETSRHYPKILHACAVPGSKECLSMVTAVSPSVVGSRKDWLRRTRGAGPQLKAAMQTWCSLAGGTAEGDDSDDCKDGEGHSDGGVEECLAFCEVQLQLLTGRTHQLRAQVSGSAAAGAGDM